MHREERREGGNVNSGYLCMVGLWILAFLLISFDVAQLLK